MPARTSLAGTTIALAAAMAATAVPAAAFDTSDPAYVARLKAMVVDGRIAEACLPTAAHAPAADYVPIPEPSADLVAAAAREGQIVLNSGLSDKPSVDAYRRLSRRAIPRSAWTSSPGAARRPRSASSPTTPPATTPSTPPSPFASRGWPRR